jgi:hypothetical protein
MLVGIDGYVIGNLELCTIGEDSLAHRQTWIVLPDVRVQRTPLAAALQADALASSLAVKSSASL